MDNQAWKTGEPLIAGGPEWLTLSFVLIGIGVLIALLILGWGTRLGNRRRRVREELEERGEVSHWAETPPPTRPITPPPVAPSPPPIADAPVPETMPAPEPLAYEPEPEPAAAETSAAPEELPEPAPLADEPIAAAAPFDASPASLAASEPEPAPRPEPEPQPAAVAPVPADDLTRMKGVGPRLAERLNTVGITSFAQLAALTPADAEALDARLGDFQGRIHRDRWIEQADYLARGDVAGYEETFGKL